jgi:hypothetical protein
VCIRILFSVLSKSVLPSNPDGYSL